MTLVSDEILDPLDFTDFEICVNCIKGKQKNIRILGANKTSNVLELVHIDIYKSFSMAVSNGQQYFITFIDDFSRYDYVYISFMRSPSHRMCSRIIKLKLRTNTAKELKASDLTVVDSTMADMTD